MAEAQPGARRDPDFMALSPIAFGEDQIARLVRCLVAETPHVALGRWDGIEFFQDPRDGLCLRCLLKVSEDSDPEQGCREFLARLESLLKSIPNNGISRVDLKVVGRYSHTPRPRH